MKNKRVLLLFIISLLSTYATLAQPKQGKANERKVYDDMEIAFQPGEELTYTASYTLGPIWTDVGEAKIKLKQENSATDVVSAIAILQTFKFYDVFFKVRDTYTSNFERKSIKPLYFYRDINEGGYIKKNTYHFDYDQNVIKGTVQKRTNPPVDTLLPLTDRTFDIVTMLYYIRNHDFSNMKENEIISLTIAIDKETYTIRVKYVGKETIRVKALGKVRSLKYTVNTIAGDVFSGNENVQLWISDDKNRLPLMGESPIKVGTVRVRLTDFRNLKFPTESIVR